MTHSCTQQQPKMNLDIGSTGTHFAHNRMSVLLIYYEVQGDKID